MPRLSGLEALAELRRIRPDVPVILMSGYTESDVSQQLAGSEVAAFLHKPFTMEELQRALEATEGAGGNDASA